MTTARRVLADIDQPFAGTTEPTQSAILTDASDERAR